MGEKLEGYAFPEGIELEIRTGVCILWGDFSLLTEMRKVRRDLFGDTEDELRGISPMAYEKTQAYASYESKNCIVRGTFPREEIPEVFKKEGRKCGFKKEVLTIDNEVYVCEVGGE